MNDSPFSKKSINANLIAIISLMVLGTIIILNKVKYTWFYLPLYWLFWGLFFIVGGYFSCRHCNFLGKRCPTWNRGIIAGKLFKRSDKKSFMDNPKWQFILLNWSFFAVAMFAPYSVFLIALMDPVKNLTIIDDILFFLYLAVDLITIYLHSKGCKKCTMYDCPLNKAGKK
jgi:hypothetical protein